jgi:hypothetical protein
MFIFVFWILKKDVERIFDFLVPMVLHFSCFCLRRVAQKQIKHSGLCKRIKWNFNRYIYYLDYLNHHTLSLVVFYVVFSLPIEQCKIYTKISFWMSSLESARRDSKQLRYFALFFVLYWQILIYYLCVSVLEFSKYDRNEHLITS